MARKKLRNIRVQSGLTATKCTFTPGIEPFKQYVPFLEALQPFIEPRPAGPSLASDRGLASCVCWSHLGKASPADCTGCSLRRLLVRSELFAFFASFDDDAWNRILEKVLLTPTPERPHIYREGPLSLFTASYAVDTKDVVFAVRLTGCQPVFSSNKEYDVWVKPDAIHLLERLSWWDFYVVKEKGLRGRNDERLYYDRGPLDPELHDQVVSQIAELF